MTSALASQLQVVAAGRPQEERLRGKASLLYDIRDAGDIDLQTIYSVGLQGTRGSHPTRTRPSASPRTATRDAPNIHPRNRRRRPLFEGLRFSRSAAVGSRVRVCNPLTARSIYDQLRERDRILAISSSVRHLSLAAVHRGKQNGSGTDNSWREK